MGRVRQHFGRLLMAIGQLSLSGVNSHWPKADPMLLSRCWLAIAQLANPVQSQVIQIHSRFVLRLESKSISAGFNDFRFLIQVQLIPRAKLSVQWQGGSAKSPSSSQAITSSWTNSWLSHLNPSLTMECSHLTKTESVTGLDIQELKSRMKDGIFCSGSNSNFCCVKNDLACGILNMLTCKWT